MIMDVKKWKIDVLGLFSCFLAMGVEKMINYSTKIRE